MKMTKLSTALLAGGLMAATAHADEMPMAGAHGTMPTMGAMLGASGIVLNGYVDVSYTQFLGDSANFRVFDGDYLGTNPGRDSNSSSFNFNQAAITIAKQPKQGAGALVNLTAGTDADMISSAGSNSGDNFDVTQAFVQYAAPAFTVMAGKFVTMAGAEVIGSTGNANISRSFMFGYAIPFTHTGARVQIPLGDSLNVFVGVNNGWDQLTEGDAGGKTGELCLTYSAGMLALGVVGYSGDEVVDTVTLQDERRDLVDAVATLKLNDALSLVLNYDYGRQDFGDGNGDAEWDGVAGYVNFQANDTVRLSARAEVFDDRDGYRTGVEQQLKEVTATVGYAVDKNLDLAFEVRHDQSNADSFLDNDGESDDQQTSLAIRGLYKF